jgi:hypothetical protein
MTVAVERETHRRVPSPGGDLLGVGTCGNPQSHGRVAKVMDTKPIKPAFGRAGRGLARGGAPTPPCSAAAGPRLVELNLREPTIPASSAYVH